MVQLSTRIIKFTSTCHRGQLNGVTSGYAACLRTSADSFEQLWYKAGPADSTQTLNSGEGSQIWSISHVSKSYSHPRQRCV
eukprot:49133-Eustigmatos_ZCMA.PRE.1